MTEQDYTIKNLIAELQKLAEEHGEETRVMISQYSRHADQTEIRRYDETDGLYFEVREVTKSEAFHTTDSTVTAGKALIIET